MGCYLGEPVKLSSLPPLFLTLVLCLCVSCRCGETFRGQDSGVNTQLQAGEEAGVRAGPLAGRVTFSGHRPSSQVVVGAADPCARGPLGEANVGAEAGFESETGLGDVVVWVEGVPAAPAATSDLTISATQCGFEPAVAVARLGVRLLADNEDDRLRSFHLRRDDGHGGKNNVQNLVVPAGEAPASWLLDRAGRLQIGSDDDPSIESWVFVYERGMATITDSEGRFELSGIPAGNWRVRFWHPQYGEVERGVLIPVDGPASLYVSLPAE